MVSHQPTGSVNLETSPRGTGAPPPRPAPQQAMKDVESVYHASPIPSMPRLTPHHPHNTHHPHNHHHHHQHRPSGGDSMLAYSERMREISKFRSGDSVLGGTGAGTGVGVGVAEPPPGTVLEVQARHIPKTGVGPPRHGVGRKAPHTQQATVRQRRPMSLDELIGRPANTDPSPAGRQRQRRMSEPGGLPSLDRRGKAAAADPDGEEKRIRISFVSAADLFDLVDFSLRSKKSREESVKLARAEDALRLIGQVNFFRSMASRRRPPAERAEDVDRASLLVQGTASPRGEGGEGRGWGIGEGEGEEQQEEEGEWARREIRQNTNPYDSDDEDDDDDDDDDDGDRDVVRHRTLLLHQPHKLRFRPRRAKRMKLPRSLLSAIPEHERQRREALSTHAQEAPSSHIPVVPSSSSLAAIKGGKNSHPVTAPGVELSSLAAIKGGKKAHPGTVPDVGWKTSPERHVLEALGEEESPSNLRPHGDRERSSRDAPHTHHTDRDRDRSNRDAPHTHHTDRDRDRSSRDVPHTHHTDRDRDSASRDVSHHHHHTHPSTHPSHTDGRPLPAEATRQTRQTRHTPRDQQEERVSKRNEASSRTLVGGQTGGLGGQTVSLQPPRKTVVGGKTGLVSGQSLDSSRKTGVLAGHSVSLQAPGARIKAQKKFRKLIFLRDQPEQTYPRYS